jgi:hypothetical protein
MPVLPPTGDLKPVFARKKDLSVAVVYATVPASLKIVEDLLKSIVTDRALLIGKELFRKNVVVFSLYTV